MTRDTTDPLKSWAHRILDETRAGVPHSMMDICKALAVLGEPL